MIEFPNNSNNVFLGMGAGNGNTTGSNAGQGKAYFLTGEAC